jgi:hypothetical protein
MKHISLQAYLRDNFLCTEVAGAFIVHYSSDDHIMTSRINSYTRKTRKIKQQHALNQQ